LAEAVTRKRTSPIRAVLRFAASVMMVSGVLLIADAGLTLAWQEPISAYLAAQDQTALKRQFLKLPATKVRKHRAQLKGDAIAKIELPAINETAYVVEGTDTGDLRKGPGHYPDTPLPGEHGTVAIAGHRTTYGAPFRHIDSIHNGDRITIAMPDGTFVYRVYKTRIVDATALWVKRRVGFDQLILSACHPLHSAAQRIVVFARYVRREKPEVKS
jgi:sortase A